MKRIVPAVLAVSAMLAGIGVAGASEPVRDWSGAYAGVFAGYGWGKADVPAPFDANTGWWYNFTGAPYSADLSGALVGGSLGYNWQTGAVVAGIEGDVGFLGLSGSAIDPNGLPATPDTQTTLRSDFHAAISARLGFATGDLLIFAKGGAALLNVHASTIDPCIAPPAGCGASTLSLHGNKTMIGWALGGGVEWALAPRWSAKAEYSYFDFGKLDIAGPSNTPGELYRQRIGVTAHAVRVGLNHHFGFAR